MKKVLVVEDEMRTRHGLSALIDRLDLGCQTIGEAEDGYEGLKLIHSMHPDVVITDIHMPKIDGLKMIASAREMGASCQFIILSGYAEFEYAKRALQLGAIDYLLKPVTISEVRALLTRLTAKDQAASSDAQIHCEGQAYSALVQEMIQVLKENLGMPVSLDMLAERFHMTADYLSNVFARETGRSFSSYRRELRMEKAKKLLLSTDMKIYEIACEVGYPDQKYFSKVFKEYTGVSAKQYAMCAVRGEA